MKIGHARMSTQDQNLALQMDALKNEDCELNYKEKISGKGKDRPELQKMIPKFRKGNILIVWKLDWLGRSLKDLIEIVGTLGEMGVKFQSIQDSINTNTPTGRCLLQKMVHCQFLQLY